MNSISRIIMLGIALLFILMVPAGVLAQTSGGVEVYSASNIKTISNSRDWLSIDNLITPLIDGHLYEIRVVTPTTFYGSDCGQVSPQSDCIEFGVDNHITNTYLDWYSATNTNVTFTALGGINEINAYAWCAGTSGCTMTSYSIWDITESPTPTVLPSATPSPTFAPTPTPSPTPVPTPIPVTKTVFVPGFGASWNGNAFSSCTFDPNPDDWSLASYAESVYNPILAALTSTGWTTKPFYYDWRAETSSNSNGLSQTIDGFVPNGEKVNIVGHSMGGIVASDYLVHHDHGTKIDSLLTIGSPLKGAPQAYPAWAGGDIWEDNFLTKVAMTLYLKHCGGIFSDNLKTIQTYVPSVRNLLPIFDYLADSKTKIVKSVSSLYEINKNNWSTDLGNLFGVKFGTLTGTGFSTLSQIQTKNPSPKEIKNGYWLDGKPAGKIYSTGGDGTVLLSSSKIDNAHNVTINQTHSGLVGSIEGMTDILKFLDPTRPWPSFNSFSEPNSALIIIGYPSNFLITDEEGRTKQDKDGMVSFVNPKSGFYKVNLLPKSNNTVLIVAQFLPNGQTLYKEYKLEGFAPKFKTLKFDLLNPREDILN